MLTFSIEAKDPKSHARAGTIETPHGKIETPAFIPVGTKATVKSLPPEAVSKLVGAYAVLANTYHLYLQPGPEILKKAGGLGKFMNWKGPTFTDSGGFQAFSLGGARDRGKSKIAAESQSTVDEKTLRMRRHEHEEFSSRKISGSSNSTVDEDDAALMARVDDDGVTFKSILDGSEHRFTPEKSIEIQHAIGADIIFAFDECVSPTESYERQKQAVDRTYEWAKRCLAEHKKYEARSPEKGNTSKDSISSYSELHTPALFGIVQGGRFEDLRKESAKMIGSMDFDGFGIGGSFDKDDIGTAVGWVADTLPENKPRHLLGIGSEPSDLILGIENGADTFDCVAPTRIARNGSVYTKKGRVSLLNAKYVTDFGPVEKDCQCYTCTNYTCAYLSHLFRAKEMLAATLASIHNLYFMVNLTKEARKAIVGGKFQEFKKSFGL